MCEGAQLRNPVVCGFDVYGSGGVYGSTVSVSIRNSIAVFKTVVSGLDKKKVVLFADYMHCLISNTGKNIQDVSEIYVYIECQSCEIC